MREYLFKNLSIENLRIYVAKRICHFKIHIFLHFLCCTYKAFDKEVVNSKQYYSFRLIPPNKLNFDVCRFEVLGGGRNSFIFY